MDRLVFLLANGVGIGVLTKSSRRAVYELKDGYLVGKVSCVLQLLK